MSRNRLSKYKKLLYREKIKKKKKKKTLQLFHEAQVQRGIDGAEKQRNLQSSDFSKWIFSIRKKKTESYMKLVMIMIQFVIEKV